MRTDDWRRVIDQAAALDVRIVQLIGGEPMLHPGFAGLVGHASDRGLSVEVFSNLTHVRSQWFDLFARRGIRLATSYYSDRAEEHDRITHRVGSHARTRANIAEAVRRSIPIRAGIIDIHDGQRVAQARADLETLGVDNIGTDRQRDVGRAATTNRTGTDAADLCGQCGRGVAAISPDGEVWPCVFARWMPVGNVRREPLRAIVTGSAMRVAVDVVSAGIEARAAKSCHPRDCVPDKQCNPNAQDCNPYCYPVTHERG